MGSLLLCKAKLKERKEKEEVSMVDNHRVGRLRMMKNIQLKVFGRKVTLMRYMTFNPRLDRKHKFLCFWKFIFEW